jgi:phenylpyruvate tautomerase PptA (4-oxalocrotonate tautomerase family)
MAGELQDVDAFIATVARLFAAEGDLAAVELLSTTKPRLDWYSHDNWDGGFDIFNLYLDTPLPLYSRLQNRKKEMEEAILKRLQAVTQAHTNDHIQSVTIVVEVVNTSDWRTRAQSWLRGGEVSTRTAGSVSASGGDIICRPEVFQRPTRPRSDG